MDIVQAFIDKNLFGSILKDLATWRAWLVALKAVFALPMTEGDQALYKQCTQRQTLPTRPFREIYLICGRRAGKSFIVAIIACFLALFKDYAQHLAPGERGVVMILANDRKQSGIILKYIKAILSLPMFKAYVQAERAESVELTNRIDIQVATCSYRSVRGYTVVAAILEESAFWRVEGANPDREIYTALKPAMATIPTSMLISISTPYSRQGLLYENFREYFGKEDEEVLVWKAPSVVMNPTLSEKMISKEKAKDLSAGRAEWDAEFREDIEAFLPLETIEKVIIPGRYELPSSDGFKYFAFADPAGGGGDNFSLSIGHSEKGKAVQDVLRARKGDPYQIVKEYCEILKAYRVREVTGDKYAGAWVSQAFEKEGITYKASELNKSEIYIEALPYINAGSVELLDSRELVKELRLLERRRGSSGKDTVDHPKSIGGGAGHDDRANVTAGIIIQLRTPSEPGIIGWYAMGGPSAPIPKSQQSWRAVYEDARKKIREAREQKVILRMPANWNRFTGIQVSTGEEVIISPDGLTSVSPEAAKELKHLGFQIQ